MVGAPLTLAFERRGDEVRMTASVDERESLRQQGRRWMAYRVDGDTPSAGEPAGSPTTLRIALFAFLAGVVLAAGFALWQKRRGRTATG